LPYGNLPRSLPAASDARIYLSGLGTTVWRPDALTRERRELLSTYQRCVKDSTRDQQQLRSYLNEHSQRLPVGFRLCRPEALPRLLKLKDWSPRQQVILTEMHHSLIAARERRTRLRRMMALEIEEDAKLLRLYKLSGLSLITTYALIAIIGDINRFAKSKNLVSYLGLNPSVVESGNSKGGAGLQAHGRGSLRSLLIQSAKMLLRTENPLQKWGLGVALRRGSNKAAVAVARKLTVALWHVMKGHWSVGGGTRPDAANQTLQTGHGAWREHAQGTGLRRQGRLPAKETLHPQDLSLRKNTINGPSAKRNEWGTTFPQTPPPGGTAKTNHPTHRPAFAKTATLHVLHEKYLLT
jgi:transposase